MTLNTPIHTAEMMNSRALLLPAHLLMKTPLVTCSPSLSLREAYSLMDAQHIGSLCIIDEIGQLLGLVTFSSLAQAILIKGARYDTPVLEVACEIPHTVSPDTPLWQINIVHQEQHSHYVLVTENKLPLGILSANDILQQILTRQGVILADISTATQFSTLAIYRHHLLSVAHEIWENNRHASTAIKMINELHLALQRRCIELTLQELSAEGLTPPPIAYAIIIIGSGGRKEMLLDPDQDNGIIIADSPEVEKLDHQRWFQLFCQQINVHLDEIGYATCLGNIMASNSQYHKTLAQWKQQITHIADSPTEKAARWANVFFDFATLYGDNQLTSALFEHVCNELQNKPRLLRMMVTDDAEGQPPLGLFNRFITLRDKVGKGKIDIKRNGLRIIADIARIYAIKHGIQQRNTLDRLVILAEQGIFKTPFIHAVCVALEELLDVLLTHQLRQFQEHEPLDKLIDLHNLSPLQQETLRMALSTIKNFQQKLQAEFDMVVF